MMQRKSVLDDSYERIGDSSILVHHQKLFFNFPYLD